MAKADYTTYLDIRKMPEGGFVVAAGSREFGSPAVFASSGIDEALAFIKIKLTEPADGCKCGAAK